MKTITKNGKKNSYQKSIYHSGDNKEKSKKIMKKIKGTRQK